MPNCKNCQKDFLITDADRLFYNKVGVPEPTWCPQCRLWRKMVWNNLNKLFKVKSSLSGKEVISQYPEDSGLQIYGLNEFWDEKFDPLDYGQDFDFSRPFFEQWNELFHKVPLSPAFNDKNENCEFNLKISTSKNCYHSISIHKSQEVYFCFKVNSVSNVFDSARLFVNCDSLWQCFACYKCTFSSYLRFCRDCLDCHYCVDCNGCQDCLFCHNLRNQQYCIYNKKLAKEEYFKEKEKIMDGSYERVLKNIEALEKVYLDTIFTINLVNCVNCHGDNLTNCANLKNSFYCNNLASGSYLTEMTPSKGNTDSMDVFYGGNGEMMYECTGYGGSTHYATCCIMGRDCSFLNYCYNCYHSQYSFGCVSLKANKYCILNKQYSEEEYPKMVEKIKEHMIKTGEYGELFPPTLAPFSYNETTALDYFPLPKEEVLARGLRWREEDRKEFLPASASLPDNIKETPDEIIKELLACTKCGRNYKIIAQELKFHRQFNYPLPRLCYYCRMEDFLRFRRDLRLYKRNCLKCSKEFEISIAPDKPEKVYCTECYQKEIY